MASRALLSFKSVEFSLAWNSNANACSLHVCHRLRCSQIHSQPNVRTQHMECILSDAFEKCPNESYIQKLDTNNNRPWIENQGKYYLFIRRRMLCHRFVHSNYVLLVCVYLDIILIWRKCLRRQCNRSMCLVLPCCVSDCGRKCLSLRGCEAIDKNQPNSFAFIEIASQIFITLYPLLIEYHLERIIKSGKWWWKGIPSASACCYSKIDILIKKYWYFFLSRSNGNDRNSFCGIWLFILWISSIIMAMVSLSWSLWTLPVGFRIPHFDDQTK